MFHTSFEKKLQTTYRTIPTVEQFKKDSSVTLKFRKDDRIVSHLDWLLERYWARAASMDFDASIREVVVCDLFLTANSWITLFHQKNPAMDKGRYPAVLALFEAAVNHLCQLFGCGRQGLESKITEIFGREMQQHGITVDSNRYGAIYFDAAQRALRRLRFRGGMAYRYILKNRTQQLVPVNSSDFFTAIIRPGQGSGTKDYAPFVMTLDRTFYMGLHQVGNENQKGIYHSAYTGGAMVSAAGTMLIEHGVIKGLRPDSGHYQPKMRHVLATLTALGMYGVSLKDIAIRNKRGEVVGKAIDFMKENLNWDRVRKHMNPKQPTNILNVNDVPEGTTRNSFAENITEYN